MYGRFDLVTAIVKFMPAKTDFTLESISERRGAYTSDGDVDPVACGS
jgi:hypothetical protein